MKYENLNFRDLQTLSFAVTLLLTCSVLAGCAAHGKNNLLVVNEGQDFAWADKGYVYELKEKGICMTETYHKAVEDLKVSPL